MTISQQDPVEILTLEGKTEMDVLVAYLQSLGIALKDSK